MPRMLQAMINPLKSQVEVRPVKSRADQAVNAFQQARVPAAVGSQKLDIVQATRIFKYVAIEDVSNQPITNHLMN